MYYFLNAIANRKQLVETQLDPLLKGDRAGELSKDRRTVLAEVWGQLRNEELVVQEMAQAIFIGNESLLSNLTFLLHYMIQNPACIAKLRAELDTLNIGLYGYRVWRDPKVMRLGYLVSGVKIPACQSSQVHAIDIFK